MMSRKRQISIVAAVGLLAGMVGTAQAELVTFDEYPSGTQITDQYLDQGVLFSGNGGDPPPDIYDYGPGSYGRVLKSYDWYSAMVIQFVEPTDPGTYRSVSQIAFDNPVDGRDGREIDYIVVNVFDADDNLIYDYTSTSPERVEIDLGACIGAYMILDDDQNTAYIIDNLFFSSDGGPSSVEPGTWGHVKSLYR